MPALLRSLAFHKAACPRCFCTPLGLIRVQTPLNPNKPHKAGKGKQRDTLYLQTIKKIGCLYSAIPKGSRFRITKNYVTDVTSISMYLWTWYCDGIIIQGHSCLGQEPSIHGCTHAQGDIGGGKYIAF